MVFDISVALTWVLFLALFPIAFFWLRRAWRILLRADYSEVAIKGGEPPGYVYLTTDVVNTRGYSSKPIDILVGIANDGTIVGAKLVEHHEPIVLIGIPQSKVDKFINDYIGLNLIKSPTPGNKAPSDIISGAQRGASHRSLLGPSVRKRSTELVPWSAYQRPPLVSQRFNASCAIAWRASSRNSSSTLSIAKNF